MRTGQGKLWLKEVLAHAASTIEVPNLDEAFLDPDELEALGNVFELLRDYCRYRSIAMRFRTEGNLQAARDNEAACEEIYESLPSNARWVRK